MADASTYDHRDPYANAYHYFQHQHHGSSQRPLTLSHAHSGALMSYNSYQTPPSPLYSSPTAADFWYSSYPTNYNQFPPTPTSPYSSYSSSSVPSYPSTPTSGRGTSLPDVPDYLASPRDSHSSSIPRAHYDVRAPPPARPAKLRTKKASAKAISELYPMRLTDLPEDERSCNICMETYVELRNSTDQPKREHALRMPCGHVFGSYCIKQWLQTHVTCPACRMEVDYIEVEEEESLLQSRGRRPSLSTHESIVNDLFGEPYRDPINRSRTPHQSTLRPRSYYGAYEPEPRLGTIAPTSTRPSIRRAQTSMGQGSSSQLPRYPFCQPPPPELNRHASQARMYGIREEPYARPGSSSSSAAATTQSEPTRSGNGYYSQARAGSFRRPDLRCALEGLRLCNFDLDDERSYNYSPLLRLDCGHGYHTDCLHTTMKAKGNGLDLSAATLWCERCRKYLEWNPYE